MKSARQHVPSVVIALVAGVVVGLVGALAEWSTGGVYLALLTLIVGLGTAVLAGEQRRRGRRGRHEQIDTGRAHQ